MNTLRAIILAGVPLVATARAIAGTDPVVLDAFDDLSAWTVAPSSGVTMSLSQADGVEGKGLRVDFDFQRGSGFAVFRRPLDIPLPPNYRFAYSIRGQAPPNTLEFKLVDPSGDNVWWVNQRGFEFPESWRTVQHKTRHVRFAWGPSGGKAPLSQIGAIEFAITAGTGGKGYIIIDSLTLEALPKVGEAPPVSVHSSSSVVGTGATATHPASGDVDWRSAPDDRAPSITLDLGMLREFGGLAIEWDTEDYATDYDVMVSRDGAEWETAYRVSGGSGGRDDIPLRECEARLVRLVVRTASRSRGVAIQRMRVMDLAYGDSMNEVFKTAARSSPRGMYPRYFVGEQSNWNVIGVSGDASESLINEEGLIETGKGSFSLEPFLIDRDRVISWADARSSQSLAEGYLPIPVVTWRCGGLLLEITAFAHGSPGSSTLCVRYRVTNTGADARMGALVLAIRPFQVLPPWQDLNIAGGAASIRSIEFDGATATVNGAIRVTVLPAPDSVGATAFSSGEIGERWMLGRVPVAGQVRDPRGFASGSMTFGFDLAPGASDETWVTCPLSSESQGPPSVPEAGTLSHWLDEAADSWRAVLGRVKITVPPQASHLIDVLRSNLAYILINRDGPAIQPGSRTYERTWIRDGALTSTALLYFGFDEEVRDFLDWFAQFQYEDGKIPCCADARGPDPVPEHDSHGQYIHGVLTYHSFTKDREFLGRHYPRVLRAVAYIEHLRSQRYVEPFRSGPPEERAKFGLVPESISHEGYSAKPMHSYWDDLFVLLGLKDAATIADAMGDQAQAVRLAALRDDFERDLISSIRLAMQNQNIDFIPGCVELGDFDATSTAVAVFPCGELGRLPEPALHNTFERYWKFFCDRRDGRIEWRDYTPYELRLCSTFIMLGQPERAHALIDFFMRDQRPPGWNHWAEVVHRNPIEPRMIGDMPHTWVGSEFVKAMRHMIAYEREDDRTLVLCAGIPEEWVFSEAGVAAENLPTPFGPVSLSLKGAGSQATLSVSGQLRAPPGGLVFRFPGGRRILKATVNGTARPLDRPREIVLREWPSRVVIDLAP